VIADRGQAEAATVEDAPAVIAAATAAIVVETVATAAAVLMARPKSISINS
jgi:hypothetical protein